MPNGVYPFSLLNDSTFSRKKETVSKCINQKITSVSIVYLVYASFCFIFVASTNFSVIFCGLVITDPTTTL
ncbi:hypothetical protein D2A91_13675 [Enterococcus faecalis]|nr:hypothetical protein [Enterococcus faecalis]TQB25215.1 hypothetical protein FKZ00_14105 [Enterococcus faecalis]